MPNLVINKSNNHISQPRDSFKGMAYPNNLNMLSFILPQVIPNLHDWLSSTEHLKKCWPFNENQWDPVLFWFNVWIFFALCVFIFGWTITLNLQGIFSKPELCEFNHTGNKMSVTSYSSALCICLSRVLPFSCQSLVRVGVSSKMCTSIQPHQVFLLKLLPSICALL